ncbi:NADH-quinone oxidoreductase subunit N 2 [Nitrospira tepida]|uniref:NADH-quinone oxidoreductase subunit N n=1 Tax=Nitrospira tepida TaxID=2973512 RepID=A0AA86MWR7_9BACT|nr:NADH-quinone oxidoreductase subunit N [Nitrospira tepida]CAI4030476.1 NADH-quinone oxidoreductase subunit N 2 [Nitrospira tepida]
MMPSVADLLGVLPELIVVAAACLVLVLDPITAPSRKDTLAWLSLAALAVCCGITAAHLEGRTLLFSNLVIIDAYGGFWKLLLYVVTGLTILLSLAYMKEERLVLGEYHGFLLLSLLGMMVMVSANDLLTIYLGTELMSLSLYILAGTKRYEARSLEASAKYFVLGAFSSGILLYGISLLFGVTGSTKLDAIASGIAQTGLDNPMLLFAMVLLVVGFGFKLAVVPFHMWTPDVYEGSPTSVTAFMAVASKAASFAAFLRVFLEGLPGLKGDWSGLLIAVCLATLLIGNLVAIVQTNMKRMLAYSSIAHAGYALIGVVAAGSSRSSEAAQGLSSVMFYLAVYSFMTLGAFAMVALLRRNGLESEEIESFTGLAKRQPLAALLMLVFMISLAGIPPTAGFIGKFYLFMAAVHSGLTWLAVAAVIFAAISAYYYLRVVMVMYMREPDPQTAAVSMVTPSPALTIVLVSAIVGVILFGLFPGPLISLTTSSLLPLP